MRKERKILRFIPQKLRKSFANGNPKPDTLLYEDEYMETLGSDDVNQEEREDDDLRDTSENNDEETTYNNTS